jgi:hypothetical protein
MKDPSMWTVELTAADHAELDAAVHVAKASGKRLTDVKLGDFPLHDLARKLDDIGTELLDGRGFVLLRRLNFDRYSADDLTLMFWGMGLHLGLPWYQNRYGELISDVTDRGTNHLDPNQRDDERAGIAFAHHTDGADLIGLMCLASARSGGVSCLANTVAIYNDLCKTRPELLSALHEEVPFDLRGGHRPGAKPFYMSPVFAEFHGRLFVQFVGEYIRTSQWHPEAPRLTPLVKEAIEVLSAMAADPHYNVYMVFQPGDVQFLNNYHILHARTAYVDAPELGLRRHLKRLWLLTDRLKARPPHFRGRGLAHWFRSPLAREQRQA